MGKHISNLMLNSPVLPLQQLFNIEIETIMKQCEMWCENN